MVIDMKAKTEKREARMTAKKEARAGQQTEAEEMAEAGAPSNEDAADVNNAVLEKKAQNADVAKAVQKPQTAK